MAVVIGEIAITRFSYLEYQALMLALACIICMGFIAIEVVFRRSQVLSVLFPGMFSIRERRFYFFDLAIEDVVVGQQLRWEAKMLTRLTLWVVLSYLWQTCVLETVQVVGKQFPRGLCTEDRDCFASELHYLTLLHRQHHAVNCSGSDILFKSHSVVSCVRFVKPSATAWLMHLAIAHSLTQMTFKCYELLTWLSGSSTCFRRLMTVVVCLALCAWLALYLSGIASEFVSSWLSFVMSLSIPLFFCIVYRSSRLLDHMYREAARKLQRRIEDHLTSALADFHLTNPEDERELKRGFRISKFLSPSHARDKISTSLAMGAKGASELLSRVLSRQRGSRASGSSEAWGSPVSAGARSDESGPLAASEASAAEEDHDTGSAGVGP